MPNNTRTTHSGERDPTTTWHQSAEEREHNHQKWDKLLAKDSIKNLFGYTATYTTVLESQAKGTLHHHILMAPNNLEPRFSEPPLPEPSFSEPPFSEPPLSEPPRSEPPLSEPNRSEPLNSTHQG